MKLVLPLIFFLTYGLTSISFSQNTFPNNGNVGIGTNSPNKLLDVNGKSIFRDKAVFDGVLKYDFYKDTSLLNDRILTITPSGRIRPMRTAFADSIFVNDVLKIGDSSIWVGEEPGGENALWSDNGPLLINSNSGSNNEDVFIVSQYPSSRMFIGIDDISNAPQPQSLNYNIPPTDAKMHLWAVGLNAIRATTDHCLGSAYRAEVSCSTSKFLSGYRVHYPNYGDFTETAYIDALGDFHSHGGFYAGKMDKTLGLWLPSYAPKGFKVGMFSSGDDDNRGLLFYDVGNSPNSNSVAITSVSDYSNGILISSYLEDGTGSYDNHVNLQMNGEFNLNSPSADLSFSGGQLRLNDGRIKIEHDQPMVLLEMDLDYSSQATKVFSVKESGTENFAVSQQGNVYAREIEVKVGSFPDYVFDEGYDLMPFDELREFISNSGHLPGVPSEKEVIQENLKLKEMNLLMMEKIEELTLYILMLNDKIENR